MGFEDLGFEDLAHPARPNIAASDMAVCEVATPRDRFIIAFSNCIAVKPFAKI
jgi:hypothetical protein